MGHMLKEGTPYSATLAGLRGPLAVRVGLGYKRGHVRGLTYLHECNVY